MKDYTLKKPTSYQHSRYVESLDDVKEIFEELYREFQTISKKIGIEFPDVQLVFRGDIYTEAFSPFEVLKKRKKYEIRGNVFWILKSGEFSGERVTLEEVRTALLEEFIHIVLYVVGFSHTKELREYTPTTKNIIEKCTKNMLKLYQKDKEKFIQTLMQIAKICESDEEKCTEELIKIARKRKEKRKEYIVAINKNSL